ncbi:PTPA-CTERM sorting domain-containing protein [Anabaena sp. CCY 0017]|uniref:PTPA-CTERM sorting domain-containing protein n=1 Tax=Anabaena sp. CCY 0017 TaxID=3103866 RepID=UPI0039C62709
MFAQNTLNRGFLVAAATASVCCGTLVMAAPSYAAGFTDYYNPTVAGTGTNGNWTLNNGPNLNSGNFNVSADLTQITLARPSNSGSGNTDFTIAAPSTGSFSFNWSFTPTDGRNRFAWLLNGTPTTIQNILVDTENGDSITTVNGVFSPQNISQGDTFGFRLFSDPFASATTSSTVSISNFSAPVTPPPGPVIPTPAMLPGLVGMWMAAMRKKRQQEAVKEEA